MSEQEHGKGTYIKIWLWLLAITVVGFIISPLGLPGWLHNSLITLIGLMKGVLIVAYFMHLKFEKITMIYSIILPLILLLALGAVLLYEGATPFYIEVD